MVLLVQYTIHSFFLRALFYPLTGAMCSSSCHGLRPLTLAAGLASPSASLFYLFAALTMWVAALRFAPLVNPIC